MKLNIELEIKEEKDGYIRGTTDITFNNKPFLRSNTSSVLKEDVVYLLRKRAIILLNKFFNETLEEYIKATKESNQHK